jgi:cytochrome c peroxidase
MTAPYLHDGSVNKLEDVVKVMMIYQLGMEVEGAEQDIKAIVAFLKTLTGKYNGKLL